MTKRLVLHDGKAALAALNVHQREFAFSPRFDINPGEFLGAIWTQDNGSRAFSGFRWGLTPTWWDESHTGHRLFSARAETLAQKPAFADALRFRRAIVPVNGIWAWEEVDGENRPFLIRSKSSEPFYLAAIYDIVVNEFAREEKRLALGSVEANRLLEPFGARMPALLRASDVDTWLERGVTNEKTLLRLLKTPPARDLTISATDKAARGWASLRESDDSREALAWVFGQKFRGDKPRFAPRKRLVMREHEAGDYVFFRTRSFTRDDATQWHPVVDLEGGHVFCDCPDFRYRHAHHEPDVWTPHWWCKHVARAVANCRRHGQLPSRQLDLVLDA